MGIDNDCHLIFGWQVNREKVEQFLQKEQPNWKCRNFGYCFGGDCWCQTPEKIGIPKGFTLVECSPYYEAPEREVSIYLTALGSESQVLTFPSLQTLSQSLDWELARQFAINLGAHDLPPKLRAEPHIY